MALDANSTHLPGKGTVFIGPVDATPPVLATLDPTKPDTYEGWKCLGHTSRENQVALAKDGGDATQLGSWWDAAIRESREATTWSWTVNSLQVDAATLQLAFPSGTAEDGVFWVPGDDSTSAHAAFILSVDTTGRMGVYLPNSPLALGDAPEYDLENFFEIQLSGSVLSSPTTGRRIGFFKDSISPAAEEPAEGK